MADVQFVNEDKIGDFIHPWSAMICGVTGSGKTVFLSKIISETIRKKWFTIYVTCQGYDVSEERQIVELREKVLRAEEDKDIETDEIKPGLIIAQAPNMGGPVISKLLSLIKTLPVTQPKHLIFDNFTYDLSADLLDLLTFNRKLNTSVSVLMHDLFSNPRLGPRLRGSLKYSVIFYLGSNVSNLRYFFTSDEMRNEYLDNVHYRNFKKLIWKNQENKACIASPDFIPKIGIDKDLIPKGKSEPFESTDLAEETAPPTNGLSGVIAQLNKRSGLAPGPQPDPSPASQQAANLGSQAQKGIASGKRGSGKSRGLQRKR